MITEYIKSLSLDSVGLFVLSLGILISDILRSKTSAKKRLPAIINQRGNSLFETLESHKMLFLGITLFLSSLLLAYFNYDKAIVTRNRAVIIEAHNTVVLDGLNYRVDENMVIRMEQSLNLRQLSKQITSEIKDWSTDTKDLNVITFKPLCVMLFEIYLASSAESKALAYERTYRDFYKLYYGNAKLDQMIDDFRMNILIKKEADRQRLELQGTIENGGS